jgi:hypothetical protein
MSRVQSRRTDLLERPCSRDSYEAARITIQACWGYRAPSCREGERQNVSEALLFNFVL